MKCGTCINWVITEINSKGEMVLSKMGEHSYGYCLNGENFVFFGASNGCVMGRYSQADESIIERRKAALKRSKERQLKMWLGK